MIYNVAIIGGGASGLMCAISLSELGISDIALIERNDRVGKKLSATGNGQGNISNTLIANINYHSVEKYSSNVIEMVYKNFDRDNLLKFFFSLGGLFCEDERGRIYPTSKQASSITDLMRFKLAETKTNVFLSKRVCSVKFDNIKNIFEVIFDSGEVLLSKKVVICCGGKVAKNFGTDGSGYEIAKSFTHTITKLYPSLVQLKTKEIYKNLKGVRVDTVVTAFSGGVQIAKTHGEVIFTEFGLSGNAIFNITPSVVDKSDVTVEIEFLPEISLEDLTAFILSKMKNQQNISLGDLLCGIINNQLGRAILKNLSLSQESLCKDIGLQYALKIATLIKKLSFEVVDTAGFDNAQVTKGGIRLNEVDFGLESNKQKGLYFAGEILDVDGDCGGYNLQWAFSSGRMVAQTIANQLKGQNDNS